MSNSLGNKKIMAANINYYMTLHHKSRLEMCEILDVKYTTFCDWVNAKTYPRIDKIEKMAKYFGISKADLVEERGGSDNIMSLTPHEKDLINAYRNKPELQPAVDKLLDVPAEKQELKLVGRDGKVRKGKEAEDYLREANEQAAKITDKPKDFGI